MTITEEQRNDKVSTLPPTFIELYSAPQSGEFMYAVFQKHSLEEAVYTNYATVIGDVILGFYKTTDLPSLFTQQLAVAPEVAKKMTTDLLEFLSPVIERETAQQIPTNPATPKATAPEAPAVEPASAVEEEDTGNVKPLRTMQADMNRVHGYGAFRDEHPLDDEPVHQAAPQDDLLKR